MKKIFTLCAAVFAAMSMSAAITNMTCAEAANAAAALEHNVPGTDTVCVTGYVTNTDGVLSERNGINQQVFWMDDVKGSTKTFEGYWCNMPSNDEPALNVGDKVSITGVLMRYNSTYEMKNGAIVILERAVVKVDTISDMTLCEIVDEALALNNGEYSNDFFQVEAVVTNASDVRESNNDQTFEFTCADNSTILKVYNCKLGDNKAVAKGDTVEVLGKLMNYGGVAEMTTGSILNIKSGNLVVDTIHVNVSAALDIAMALENGATAEDIYVITGYVDSISTAYSEQYKNISFFLTDDMAAPTYEFQCYRVKGGEDIKVGDKVAVTGKITHYYKAATETADEVHGYQTPAGATYEFVSAEAINNRVATVRATKALVAGELVIIKGDRRFNVLGF